MGVTEPIQNSLFVLVTGAGVEFGGNYCAQDCTLKDPDILAQPQVTLSTTEPDIDSTIEQK